MVITTVLIVLSALVIIAQIVTIFLMSLLLAYMAIDDEFSSRPLKSRIEDAKKENQKRRFD